MNVIIDGIEYAEIPDTDLPFGNVCRYCAFSGTPCYNRDDFTCHSDAKEDGVGVVFVAVNKFMKCPCGNPATWIYMPGDAVACDDCVPRGCSCQQEPRDGDFENDDPDNWFDPVDNQGRKIPCVEWWMK